jgi:hypothetical protein
LEDSWGKAATTRYDGRLDNQQDDAYVDWPISERPRVRGLADPKHEKVTIYPNSQGTKTLNKHIYDNELINNSKSEKKITITCKYNSQYIR